MIQETIKIQNLKCGGCAHTIKEQLGALPGALSVSVNTDTDEVSISHEESLSRTVISEKLKAIGYPEAGDDNSTFTKVKSYASCMIGKISKDNDE